MGVMSTRRLATRWHTPLPDAVHRQQARAQGEHLFALQGKPPPSSATTRCFKGYPSGACIPGTLCFTVAKVENKNVLSCNVVKLIKSQFLEESPFK
jgi:hypothetical protein